MKKKVIRKIISNSNHLTIDLNDFLISRFQKMMEEKEREKKVLLDKLDLQTKGKEIVLENTLKQ